MRIYYEMDAPAQGHIGWAIHRRREELGISQEELVRVLGISKQTLSRHELAKSVMIEQRLLEQIATALGTTAWNLWQDTEKPIPKKIGRPRKKNKYQVDINE